jgi:YceI-like domain
MNCATLCTFLAISGFASASPVTYTIDPDHTHPEFEADHLGGVSIWRGLFKRTSGTIILDAPAQTGTLDVAIDITSVEFGNDKLNEEAVNSTAPPRSTARTSASPSVKVRTGTQLQPAMRTRNTIFTMTMPFVTILSRANESSGEIICRPCEPIIRASRARDAVFRGFLRSAGLAEPMGSADRVSS